jgi:hypothetical protein
VLILLTLFAVVGITFVLYADAEAQSARLAREAQSQDRPDVEPEVLLAYFLGHLIYDTDDQRGVYSALRGHSLARLMYGSNDESDNNFTPFNGSGRLHTGPGTYMNPFQRDDYFLVNYTYFPADGFLRDPERLGLRTSPLQPRGPYCGGFNPPYTYPDLNNMFLAAVRADGTVLVPSFHRSWTGFGSLAPDNPNWYDTNKPWLKYQVLRPRPADMGPGFPVPESAGGDVKNLVDAPGGNDSIWLDLDFPVLTAPDGRKYKALFAPLIVDLDGRVNVNVHGNVRGQGRTHVSNHGLGPWEVNLGRVLTKNDNEWANLFVGNPASVRFGRYGRDQQPATAGRTAPSGRRPHFYAQVDFDACQELAGFVPSGALQLPAPDTVPLSAFPIYSAGHGNRSTAERLNHPLLSNNFRPAGDDRRFSDCNLEALLRQGDTGSSALISELLVLCPRNFADPRIRRLVTTHSFDRDQPGVTPWLFSSPRNPPPPYQVPASSPTEAPAGPPLPFPPLALRTQGIANGEFDSDWRADDADLGRVNLNRRLTPYPLPSPQTLATYNARFDVPDAAEQFQRAQQDRQRLADAIYRRLLAVTGPPTPLDPTTPTDAELAPRRWLAQLAVNIVDYIDEDDISTPFNFYTATDAGSPAFDIGARTNNDPELPRYWVFGTELPHVVLNEALAETAAIVGSAGPRSQVKVWVELFNPFQTPPAGQRLQSQDGFPVPLRVQAVANSLVGRNQAYNPYRVVVATGLLSRPVNDNVLGRPDNQVRTMTTDDDFAVPADLAGGGQQPPQTASVPSPFIDVAGGPTSTSFFLLAPPRDANPRFRDPLAIPPAGTVPAGTPLVRSPNLQYTLPAEQVRLNERSNGLTILLRRLANPHLPFDPNPVQRVGAVVQPNPWYNPYVTVDYLDSVPLRDAAQVQQTAPYAARGKRQPYAAFSKLQAVSVYQLAADSPMADQTLPSSQQVNHTFGRPNEPLPFGRRYDWLIHLDRSLFSPMELLHISGCQPYQLTQRFLRGSDAVVAMKFQHYAPWFDQTRRLYRVLEFLEMRSLAAGTGVGGRLPGKINLNTIWDAETFRALCDPQPPNSFTLADVDAMYQRMVQQRTPESAPGPNDRPFLSLATGYSLPNSAANPDPQYPTRGRGINDTFLRSAESDADTLPDGGSDTPRLFQVPNAEHPYLQDQLLTKIFNHTTTRSNVFAVWLTVAFFEVTDDSARPVKLGAEINRSEGRYIRHRMFAIVDRSVLSYNQGPPARFIPSDEPKLVPYFSIIN